MCTSGIDHTSNFYYYSVMSMRTIFCLIQGRDEPTEVYHRIFEAEISIDVLENFNATTHMELNKSYVDGDDKYCTKRFRAMCLIMSSELEQYSGIWKNLNNSILLGTENHPKTTTAAYNLLCCYKKPVQLRQVHVPPAAVTFVKSVDTEKNKTAPGNDGYSFQKLYAITARIQ